jgi:hypothetical protein
MLLFFAHELQADKERRDKVSNRNCAHNAFHFSFGAEAVPSTVTGAHYPGKLVLSGNALIRTMWNEIGGTVRSTR